MNSIRNGWFSEINPQLWPGQCLSLEVDEILHETASQYQQIMVIQTKNHGRALILDGIIQCTEHDEFAYQEMIALLPLCSHSRPRRVLIVGGGDGGVARECLKHPHVEQIVQVEIDGQVVAASKQFLPHMAQGFQSPKMQLIIGDGFEYMAAHRNEFDVIITDSSDPIGPAVNLFTAEYFALLKAALRPGGVVCSQGGSVWTGLQHVKETMANCRQHFAQVKYAWAAVPTYPSGQIGFVLARDDAIDLIEPQLTFTEDEMKLLRYYNADVHRAAFVLPTFVRNELS